jgi:hypothetical protein
MMFLNKTCYNGLWRVNSKGEFNVPMGTYKTIKLYDKANLLAASRALAGVELAVQDFRKTLAQTRAGDFVYIDPPYHPVSSTAYFTAYTKDDFGFKEQQDLALAFYAAARKGANLMLSNSDTESIRRLYRQYKIHSVQARRRINSRGEGRGTVPEVVVLGYTKDQYMKMLNNSARFWLLENDYADVARMIDEIIIRWQKKGKRTRRNWWEVLAGDKKGNSRVIQGQEFPVLRAARIRQGLPLTEGCLCRNAKETLPAAAEQVRWNANRRKSIK